jgi:hypothetical protein
MCAVGAQMIDFDMDMPLFGALADPEELDVTVNPMVITQPSAKRPIGKRIFKDLKRKESAAQAVAELERDGMEIFGLTRGQFSLADMIEAIVQKTGPVEMVISTWTAATTDASQMQALLKSGLILDCKWLVDISLVRRKPELASQVREQFGPDAIRVMQTHAKFVLLRNAEWQVVIRSSMNLNQNPRLESFQVGHDPEMAAWLQRVVDDVWKRQPRKLSEGSVSSMFAWWAQETGIKTKGANLGDEA